MVVSPRGWLKWRVNAPQSITTAANDTAVVASSSTGAPLQQRQIGLPSPPPPPMQQAPTATIPLHLAFCRAVYERHCRPSSAGVDRGRKRRRNVPQLCTNIYNGLKRRPISSKVSPALSHEQRERGATECIAVIRKRKRPFWKKNMQQ